MAALDEIFSTQIAVIYWANTGTLSAVLLARCPQMTIILGIWELFRCSFTHTLYTCSQIRESNTHCTHCMLTSIKLYACYAVKLYKNKTKNIFQTGGGGAPGAPVLDPPLNLNANRWFDVGPTRPIAQHALPMPT